MDILESFIVIGEEDDKILKSKVYENVLMGIYDSDIEKGVVNVPEGVKATGKTLLEPKSQVKKIIFPSTLEYIASYTFKDAKNLEEVVLPENLTEIAPKSFLQSRIARINLPKNLKEIKDYTFKKCHYLTSVTLPSQLSTIGEEAFADCNSLNDINLQRVKEVGRSAFKSCSQLSNVKFGELETIGLEAFSEAGLEEVELPNSLKILGDGAFKLCWKLKKVKLPDSLKKLDNAVFLGCSRLKDVIFPKDLIKIGENAFGETGIKRLTLPESVRFIDENAFVLCSKLTEVNFPKNLEIIGLGAFSGCKNLREVALSSPRVTIGCEAFSHCTNLQSFKMGKGEIREDAFEGCKNLKRIEFEEGSIYNLENLNFSPYLNYLTKEGNKFIISAFPSENSIDITKLKGHNLSFLIGNWDMRKKILGEITNENVLNLYEDFNKMMSKEQFKSFLESKNIKFFKQIKNFPKDRADFTKFCTFYYNIGGFSQPITEEHISKKGNNIKKVVDYAQLVGEFMIAQLNSDKISLFLKPNLFERMNSLKKFNPEFTKFLLDKNVFAEIEVEQKRDPNFLENCFLEFEKVQRTNTSNKGNQRQLKATTSKFKDYFINDKFKGVKPSTYHIAATLSPFYSNQSTFEDAVKIDEERISNNVPDHILGEALEEKDVFAQIDSLGEKIQSKTVSAVRKMKELADEKFSFEWLAKNDPKNFILGKLCSCCAHLEGIGHTIARASIVHPDVQNLVVKNEYNEIVAKSTLYVNRRYGYGVLNTISIYSNYKKQEDLEKIFRKIELGVAAFVDKYNKLNPENPIKKVNVGMGNNSAQNLIEEELKRERHLLSALNYKQYGRVDPSIPNCNQGWGGDSDNEQYTIWEE